MLNIILNKLAEIPNKIGLKKYQIFPKESTSLILVNCQKGFLNEQPELKSKLENLIAFARQNDWKIIHAPFGYKELKFPSPALLLMDEKLNASSTGNELLYVEKGDIILPSRTTLSAFSDTDLENVLKQNGLEHLVLAGPMADLTLDSTMRDGVQYDFHVAVVTDVMTLTNNTYTITDYIPTLSKYAQTVTNFKKLKRLALKSNS